MSKDKSHSWTFRICTWHVCSKCGLIRLNNKATNQAANKACPGKED
ncbi:hypothetical protein CPT_Mendera_188 [Stenotrophomonas phage Mendera]|uniref:Uncharacterized protein n=1 Tax=Stenotrophomonas phage Mendera TaxID=2650877 RepID=A0A5P8PJ60_9CAUD|nr:hypothetical protein HWC60_gp227 [Stenotrophomonas phage Mendera]QFR56714.1 hypothetical protein CPT_Mendera_188 [Stenotrophomonas phage Mendera]